VSVGVAGVLVGVAVVRMLSYLRGGVGEWVVQSPLGWLAYRPEDPFSVRYFKFLATPAFVSVMYFMFRGMNHGLSRPAPGGYLSAQRPIDFGSPWVRLSLLGVVNVHWVVLETYKFLTESYPYSTLESWESNAVVLGLSGVVTFFAMSHLSFRPVWSGDPPPS